MDPYQRGPVVRTSVVPVAVTLLYLSTAIAQRWALKCRVPTSFRAAARAIFLGAVSNAQKVEMERSQKVTCSEMI